MMKKSHEWDPVALQKSPFFVPLQPVLSLLNTGEFPTLSDFNELLAQYRPAISVQAGHHLRFVPQETGRLGFESQYEPRCYLTGEVQTRTDNLHDLFNALVWLVFPRAKAAINNRHYQALTKGADTMESQRGRVRDMATLLDESGVIVVCADTSLTELLLTFQWKELFYERREQVSVAMGFYIFGHGLYEKAMQPYVGMTAQGLMINVKQEFFSWSLLDRLAYLDERVAGYLSDPGKCLSPRELHPVPLLGIPGWDAANSNAAYYDNTSYFRVSRRGTK